MSKYHAIRTQIDGIKFASKKEAQRYLELKLMQKAGVIKDLRMQVPFILIEKSEYGRQVKYIADFTYYENHQNGIWKNYVVEDTKGFRTDVYKLKKRMLAEKYGIVIKET
ncbi:MAG: DUF1064 domain-containing protein [Bacteroidales bacterium]|nr:DUF1064 domain-containing protein [Candidatus Scybalousia scybalohippi]